jgi:hypothetical protein
VITFNDDDKIIDQRAWSVNLVELSKFFEEFMGDDKPESMAFIKSV